MSLENTVKTLPKKPGVYIMKDFDGVPIYIGKAKDLRTRVRTYFGVGDGRAQIEYLIRKVATIDTVVTPTEGEAILVERDLINKHKPRYNIRLKDDKAYLSIRIDHNSPWPRLELVRRVQPDGADYYGPFPSTYRLRDLLEVIKRVVPLRSCTDTVFFNRQRPCLEYQIKRCAGPCCIQVDREQYKDWLKQAVDILNGNIDETLVHLEKEMNEASENLRFEEAAALRDRVNILKDFKESDQVFAPSVYSLDCFGLYREDQFAVVSIMIVRDGRVVDITHYSFDEVLISDAELIQSIIPQYYKERDLPKEIATSCELIEIDLIKTELRSSDLIIHCPEHGPAFRLKNLADLNAKQQFTTRFFSEARYSEIAKSVSTMFRLSQVPRRIECVDISNFQGSDIVGAIVSFHDGVPDKSGYRKYKISFQNKPNDFEAIYEVVKRRLSKETLPDLLIIDGGPPQLKKALQARDELNLKLDIVSLAKIKVKKGIEKPERVYIEQSAEPILLDENSLVTQFLQRVRDEVHRFVITFHRSTRGKRVFKSILDDIPGVGVERRQRLLKAFGSIDEIKGAAIEEIAKHGRMPASLAKKIIGLLQNDS